MRNFNATASSRCWNFAIDPDRRNSLFDRLIRSAWTDSAPLEVHRRLVRRGKCHAERESAVRTVRPARATGATTVAGTKSSAPNWNS